MSSLVKRISTSSLVSTFAEEPHAPQIKRDSKTDPDLGGAFAGKKKKLLPVL